MAHRRLIVLVTLLLSAGMQLAGCGSSSHSSPTAVHHGGSSHAHVSPPNSAANFCHVVAQIDSALNAADTYDQKVAAMRNFQPRLGQLIDVAPGGERANTRTVVQATQQVLDGNTPTSPTAAAEAAHQLDYFCNLKQ